MPKSLYSQYVAEREGQRVFEFRKGFVAYSEAADHLYLQDLFVTPEFRHQNVGQKLLQYVERKAVRAGKRIVFVSMAPSTALGHTMLQLALKYGYKLSHSTVDAIYLKKEI